METSHLQRVLLQAKNWHIGKYWLLLPNCTLINAHYSYHVFRLLRRMSLSISRRSWRRCATPSSLNCTRVQVACQVGCPGDSQGAALHLEEEEDLLDQLLRKLTKLFKIVLLVPTHTVCFSLVACF